VIEILSYPYSLRYIRGPAPLPCRTRRLPRCYGPQDFAVQDLQMSNFRPNKGGSAEKRTLPYLLRPRPLAVLIFEEQKERDQKREIE
jgi:hypothetical protein